MNVIITIRLAEEAAKLKLVLIVHVDLLLTKVQAFETW
jgi:hypothetical protein